MVSQKFYYMDSGSVWVKVSSCGHPWVLVIRVGSILLLESGYACTELSVAGLQECVLITKKSTAGK